VERKDWLEKGNALFEEAKALLFKEDGDAQDAERRDQLMEEGRQCFKRAADLKEIEKAVAELDLFNEEKKEVERGPQVKSLGQWVQAVHMVYQPSYRGPDPMRMLGKRFDDPEEGSELPSWLSKQASERKDLLEQTGAVGGFLVPIEFRPELLGVIYEDNPIRQRATTVPMRRRQVQYPTLDQTGTAAGATRQHGGIVATWTEEATQKDETEPNFRQINLVAHKLVCYTEASDELLADEAVGLVSFLSGEMGFAGAIRWEEEYTFLRGTGTGQPLGVLPAACTLTVNRAAAGTFNVADIANMVQSHHGDSPTWHLSRSAMSTLIQLNGPAGNPSYFWQPSARDGMPGTLMGYPIDYTEKLPTLGTAGDILLANWKHYLIGDRQATTIDSSQHFRFRNDITAWRAVHRVDGQPWLSAPITLADGATQISPFVILGDVAS
jgi:HK97 family phage major capsid protein